MPNLEARKSAGHHYIPLAEVVEYVDRLLSHATVQDWPNAMNGLQVENSGAIHRIGAAVDACEATLAMARERGIDFLLVHHGLFWGGLQRIQGPVYRRLRLALEGDIAVMSSHLPLDLHPVFGNSAQLARAIGLENPQPFFFEKGAYIGVKGEFPGNRSELHERLREVLGGEVRLIPGGSENPGTVGVVTGGAGSDVQKAAQEGVTTFISGEASHPAFAAAEEWRVNLFLGGHYATETFGVKALAEHLSERYQLPWEFLDHPSGL